MLAVPCTHPQTWLARRPTSIPESTVFQPHEPQAEAQDGPAPAAEERAGPKAVSVLGQLGWAGPLGVAGVALEVSPIPWFVATGGIGMGWAGRQLAVGGRFRFPVTPSASPSSSASFVKKRALWLGVGARYSTGDFFYEKSVEDYVIAESPALLWEPARWLNLEVTVDLFFRSPFILQGFAGVGYLLNVTDGFCRSGNSIDRGDCKAEVRALDYLLLPFFGISGGLAFGG